MLGKTLLVAEAINITKLEFEIMHRACKKASKLRWDSSVLWANRESITHIESPAVLLSKEAETPLIQWEAVEFLNNNSNI